MKRAILVLMALGGSVPTAPAAMAQMSIDIRVATPPPPLPVYVQPPLPGADYLWTPGYWAWDDIEDAYYWVPGTWALAPRPGLLWTPPWWGWSAGAYVFHAGYWGPHVGFYGGVPYGFGYTGLGYLGGYWNGGHVYYNRIVNNITNVHITNVYRQTVMVNRITRISYNGGPGGVQARPDRQDWIAAHEAHVAPTPHQFAHLAAARSDPRLFASANHGRPSIAATPRPMAPDRIAVDPQPGRWQPHGPARPSPAMPAAGNRSTAVDRDPPMPVVHRGGRPDWQSQSAMGGMSAPQPWHNAGPRPARAPASYGGWDRPPPPPHGSNRAGAYGWGGSPHAPAPRVVFHAPPHPPARPHGGGDPHRHRG